MHLSVAFLGAFVLQAALSVEASPKTIFARQSDSLLNGVPAECRSTCTPISNSLDACLSFSCFCTNTNGNYLEDCLNCMVNAGNSDTTVISQAQETADLFENECSSNGYTVSPVTISGSSGSSSGSRSLSGTATRTSGTTRTTATRPATTSSFSNSGGGDGGIIKLPGLSNGASQMGYHSVATLGTLVVFAVVFAMI